MDIKKGLLLFGGLSISLAGAAIYAYMKEINSKKDDSLIYSELRGLLELIEVHFKINNDRSQVQYNMNDSWVNC